MKTNKLLGLLIIFFLMFSLYPTFYEIQNRDKVKPIRYFELVHNFPTDFNFYLSRIREGIEGRVTVYEKYTAEPHVGSFIHIFYLALGWAGGWSRVPWHRASDVYHVARIVAGLFLLATIGQFAVRSFWLKRNDSTRSHNKIWSLIAFLLAVTASSWPKLVAVINNQVVKATLENISNWRFGGYMAWWSVMDSLQRITHVPHLLVGQALILVLTMMLNDTKIIQKPGNWIFVGVLAILLGIIFPPGLVFFYVIIAVLIFLEYLYDKPKKIAKFWRRNLLPRLVPCAIAFPTFIYLSLMLSFYPWKRLAEFDIIKPLPFDYWEYFKAMGPILPLGLVGLLLVLTKKEKSQIASTSWIIAWSFLLIIFHFIPQQSPLRFSEMIPHVPLGVLTAYLFYFIWKRALVARSNSRVLPFGKLRASDLTTEGFTPSVARGSNLIELPARFFLIICHLSFVIPAALILLGGGVMYSSLLWQKDFIDHKIRAAFPLVPTGTYVMYPLKDFIKAIVYIQDHSLRDDVILSETTAGNYIPVYSGNTVYVGHANTVKAEDKEKVVKQFFSGKLEEQKARQWFREQQFRYVFFGPQEKEDLPAGPPAGRAGRQVGEIRDLSKVYPFLKEVYRGGFVTLYEPANLQ